LLELKQNQDDSIFKQKPGSSREYPLSAGLVRLWGNLTVCDLLGEGVRARRPPMRVGRLTGGGGGQVEGRVSTADVNEMSVRFATGPKDQKAVCRASAGGTVLNYLRAGLPKHEKGGGTDFHKHSGSVSVSDCRFDRTRTRLVEDSVRKQTTGLDKKDTQTGGQNRKRGKAYSQDLKKRRHVSSREGQNQLGKARKKENQGKKRGGMSEIQPRGTPPATRKRVTEESHGWGGGGGYKEGEQKNYTVVIQRAATSQ